MGGQRGIEGSGRSGAGRARRRHSPLIAIALGLAVGVALALPAAAPAAKKADALAMTFDVEAGNGYDMAVDAQREAGRKARVRVELSGNSHTVTYEKSHGVHLTRSEIGFRLGTLGSVEMSFDGKRRFRPNRRCDDLSVRKGIFRGRLHFRGEDSYTRAHAGKASGYVQSGAGDGRCGLFSHRKPREPRERATLSSCGPGPQLNFVAQSEAFFGFSLFSSTLQERVDGINIYRTAVALDVGEDFSFDEDNYRTAKARPAWPFAGSGTYRDGELTGDLTVWFPGKGQVALAPSDRAKLRKAIVPGRACGVDSEHAFNDWFSTPAASGSAPEDAAAVGLDGRQ